MEPIGFNSVPADSRVIRPAHSPLVGKPTVLRTSLRACRAVPLAKKEILVSQTFGRQRFRNVCNNFLLTYFKAMSSKFGLIRVILTSVFAESENTGRLFLGRMDERMDRRRF